MAGLILAAMCLAGWEWSRPIRLSPRQPARPCRSNCAGCDAARTRCSRWNSTRPAAVSLLRWNGTVTGCAENGRVVRPGTRNWTYFRRGRWMRRKGGLTYWEPSGVWIPASWWCGRPTPRLFAVSWKKERSKARFHQARHFSQGDRRAEVVGVDRRATRFFRLEEPLVLQPIFPARESAEAGGAAGSAGSRSFPTRKKARWED